MPLGLISQSGGDINISSDNTLYVSLVDLDGPAFADENVWITIDGNTYNAKTTSTIPLSRLDGTYTSGSVYNTAVVSFTPIINQASIDTLSATSITASGATARFDVLDDGWAKGDAAWTAYVGYKPHSASSSEWTWTNGIAGAGEGVYSVKLTGLPENTQMDVTSRIENEAGNVDGDVESFYTTFTTGLGAIMTRDATVTASNAAGLEALVTSDGSPVADVDAQARFVFWDNNNISELYETNWDDVEEGDTYTIMLDGLKADTTYKYLAQIKNTAGQADGNTESFKTFIDPNSAPTSFNPAEPNTILIQNYVKGFQTDLSKPHDRQGLLSVTLKSGNSNAIDANDVFILLLQVQRLFHLCL